MNQSLPRTPQTLLSELKSSDRGPQWQVSWETFLNLYHQSLRAMCSNSYRFHMGGEQPPEFVIDDAVAAVVADFCTKSQFSYDPKRGRLRGFLKTMCNARIVDHLRKQRNCVQYGGLHELADGMAVMVPDETPAEIDEFRLSVLGTLMEDVRKRVSPQQFAIFEMVKLKNMPVEQVATEMGVKRGVIDNSVYRVMKTLRDLASRPEYKREW